MREGLREGAREAEEGVECSGRGERVPDPAAEEREGEEDESRSLSRSRAVEGGGANWREVRRLVGGDCSLPGLRLGLLYPALPPPLPIPSPGGRNAAAIPGLVNSFIVLYSVPSPRLAADRRD